MQLQKAERKQAVIKFAIQGPSGSGKTYSSLLLAYGLVGNWNQIAVIDTENNSSHLYSHLGNFNVLSLSEPFSPERYMEAIETCEKAGIKVIIVDSLSHEWSGTGGILEVHGGMLGNSFTNWSKVTPRHNSFIQKILQSPCHVISTIRSKQDYVLSDKNGKTVPEKIGLAGVAREGTEYEFMIVLDIDIKHQATASKDRTGLFSNPLPFLISEQTGHKIRTWCLGEDLLKNIEVQIGNASTIQELRNVLIKYPTLREKLEPLCLIRKKELESVPSDSIVQPLKSE
jgi:hypothetical protein